MKYATLSKLVAESGISRTRFEQWMRDMQAGYHYAQECETGTRVFHRERVNQFIESRLFNQTETTHQNAANEATNIPGFTKTGGVQPWTG